MGLREDIALLKGLSIFDGLSDEYLRLLAFGAERRRLERGHVLFREGAAADCAFVVLSGSLKLTRDLPSGKDQPVGEAEPSPPPPADVAAWVERTAAWITATTEADVVQAMAVRRRPPISIG